MSNGLGPDQDIFTNQKKLVVCSLIQNSSENSFRNTFRVSSSLGPDQDIFTYKKNCGLLTFFKILQKNLSGTLSECQTVWVQIRTYLPVKKLVVCSLFSKLTYSKNSFRKTIRVSNGLGPDQDIFTYQKIFVVCSFLFKINFFKKLFYEEHYQSDPDQDIIFNYI